ncbi:uncharacterized protein LOC128738059 [Sabethes cyaneus]|uniref:uncharacterized protein LOC128738059 n=1 Tax=Sabethes cyaneus TaxID=53552 RepID=UPI00237E4637|nr:uncharacterized protein LOC128738059 [Sabethes cyaneus]
MEWTSETTLKLIELYHNNEILWNQSLPEYKLNSKKLDVFKEMTKVLGCTIAEIKQKIKNLRSQFHREHKAVKLAAGQGRSPKTQWCFYGSLQFLLSADTADRKGMFTDSYIEDNYDKATKEEAILTCKTEFDTSLISTSSRKKRKPAAAFMDDPAEEAYDVLNEPVEKDDLAIYAEYVTNEIRKLRPRTQLNVKHQINNLLYQAALQDLDAADEINGMNAMSPTYDQVNS